MLVTLYAGGVVWVWRRESGPPLIGELAELAERPAGGSPARGADGRPRPGAGNTTEDGAEDGTGRALLVLLVGLLAMVAGGALAVRGAAGLVDVLQLGESVVGLTVLALATSADMVALVWSARRRGLHQVVMAGTVGAIAYNSTVTLGLAALVSPLGLGRQNVIVTTTAVTAVLPLVLFAGARSGVLPRPVGALLVAAYVVAVGFLLSR